MIVSKMGMLDGFSDMYASESTQANVLSFS
jgi:hypothetical protein